ncbi:MAG TPA: hypothetical protein VNQ31_09840 [Sphingomonadaceae bacterium]|nr:hypothetical protein [Sphingomonadaceae bacterium]
MADLREAIARVTAGLAGIDAEVVGPFPTDWRQISDWQQRRRESVEQLAELLRAEYAARITDRCTCAVTMAGVRSTCTGGLAGALNNWCRAAERKLEGGA